MISSTWQIWTPSTLKRLTKATSSTCSKYLLQVLEVRLFIMLSIFQDSRNRKNQSSQALWWYGGVAVGVVATALVSTILWRRRVHALDLQPSPLERAEQLIESCETKLDSIEKAVAELKETKDSRS